MKMKLTNPKNKEIKIINFPETPDKEDVNYFIKLFKRNKLSILKLVA